MATSIGSYIGVQIVATISGTVVASAALATQTAALASYCVQYLFENSGEEPREEDSVKKTMRVALVTLSGISAAVLTGVLVSALTGVLFLTPSLPVLAAIVGIGLAILGGTIGYNTAKSGEMSSLFLCCAQGR